ncbi:hypothetical protein C7B61_19495 [filamentous cyanobacterium CCP1]|nr:hypothetical protein C7B76_07585 [filamentous cyanobacterium CCP2]PSB58109.1 hypothetical protein C7B61_19495 [filamentous cyanobacterium CCP1]
MSRILGLAFIGLGVYAIVVAATEHRRELQHIRRNTDYFYTPRRSLGLMVATGLIGIGLIAFIGILYKAVT